MEVPLKKGTTLAEVIDALTQSWEGLNDGNEPLEIGDAGYVTVTTNKVGRWKVTKS
jgi:hypothetical protein